MGGRNFEVGWGGEFYDDSVPVVFGSSLVIGGQDMVGVKINFHYSEYTGYDSHKYQR